MFGLIPGIVDSQFISAVATGDLGIEVNSSAVSEDNVTITYNIVVDIIPPSETVSIEIKNDGTAVDGVNYADFQDRIQTAADGVGGVEGSVLASTFRLTFDDSFNLGDASGDFFWTVNTIDNVPTSSNRGLLSLRASILNAVNADIDGSRTFVSTTIIPTDLGLEVSFATDTVPEFAIGEASALLLNGASVANSFLETIAASNKGVRYPADNVGASTDQGCFRFVLNTASALGQNVFMDISNSANNNSRIMLISNTTNLAGRFMNDTGGTNGFSFGSQLAGSIIIDTDHEIEFNWELVGGSELNVWAFIDGVFFGGSLPAGTNAQRFAASVDFMHIGTEGGGTEQFNEPVTSIKYRNVKYFNQFQHGASAGANYTPIF